MFPKTRNQIEVTEKSPLERASHGFRYNPENTIDRQSRISGTVDGVESLKQDIYHVLNTERYAYSIFPDRFGVSLEKFKRNGYGYFRARIEQEIRDALAHDERIASLGNFVIAQGLLHEATVSFTVESYLGSFDYTVGYSMN